jgi:anti-sigma regulatory factor (Ser/Thr protein kinase)/anti-anti-sigma regulatory factor
MTHVQRRVSTEVRGEVCVIHCGGVDGVRLAEELPDEVGRCLETGASAVVVDLDPWAPIDDRGLGALQTAAQAFREAGGELVVAVEEPDAREALAEAGLMRAVPAAPGPPRGEDDVPARRDDHPRWEHEFSFPATTGQLRAARRRVTAFAEVAGLDEGDVFEFSVAVAEALANAVVHGSPRGADDEVHVRFFCYDDEVAVEVVDGGGGMAATAICEPSPAATSGRGIHFMRALADAVHYTCGPLGTRVLLVKQRA